MHLGSQATRYKQQAIKYNGFSLSRDLARPRD